MEEYRVEYDGVSGAATRIREKRCTNCGMAFRGDGIDSQDFCSYECRETNHEQKYDGKIVMQYSHKHINDADKKGYGNEWQSIREEVMERDNFKCQDCGMLNEKSEEKYNCGLHIHHKEPLHTFDSKEKANEKENLVTLCPSCHPSWE